MIDYFNRIDLSALKNYQVEFQSNEQNRGIEPTEMPKPGGILDRHCSQEFLMGSTTASAQAPLEEDTSMPEPVMDVKEIDHEHTKAQQDTQSNDLNINASPVELPHDLSDSVTNTDEPNTDSALNVIAKDEQDSLMPPAMQGEQYVPEQAAITQSLEQKETCGQSLYLTSVPIEQQEVNDAQETYMQDLPPTPFDPHADYPTLRPFKRQKKYSHAEEQSHLKCMIELLQDNLPVAAIASMCHFTYHYADKLFRDAMREMAPQRFAYSPKYDLEPAGTLISELHAFKALDSTHFAITKNKSGITIEPFAQIQSDIPFQYGVKIQSTHSKIIADTKLRELTSKLLYQGHPTLAIHIHLGISHTKILNMLSEIVYRKTMPMAAYEVSTAGTRLSALKICPWIKEYTFLQATTIDNSVTIRPCNKEITNV